MKRFAWFFIWLDVLLITVFVTVLCLDYFYNSVGIMILASVAFLGTVPVIVSAVRALFKKLVSMDLLASAALLFSIVGNEWRSAVFIALMLAASRLLTALSERRTERNIESLLKLRPKFSKIFIGGKMVSVEVSDIKVGDVVVTELGGRIPIDGSVVDGRAAVDESSLTGESLPVDKMLGHKVFSSTLVLSGNLFVKAEKIGKDTTLERLIELVKNARDKKPSINTLAEKFGKIYLVAIFIVSFFLYIFTQNIPLVLSVVLVVCADDVAIAVPLAFLTAIGVAAKRGVIIKGGSFLEGIGEADMFVFDKTGTLTRGNLIVEIVMPSFESSESNVLEIAAMLSDRSNHPVSKAITAHAKNRAVTARNPEEFGEIGGLGLYAKNGEKEFIMGKRAFFTEKKWLVPADVDEFASTLEKSGKSVSIVGVDGRAVGLIGVSDEIKKNVRESLAALTAAGIKNIVMLTGDNERVASYTAKKVGINEFYANLLPEGKVEYVRKCVLAGKRVVMIGDGVNDAAALEQATIGIAMGAIGYDTAIESANIVLMNDDLGRLVELVRLSRYVRSVAIEDFWIWGVTNVLGLTLVFLGFIGPTGAAAYNFISDFFPLGNSIKVARFKFKKHIV
jgi:heavy metal translocating P-type ATPase